MLAVPLDATPSDGKKITRVGHVGHKSSGGPFGTVSSLNVVLSM